MEPGSARDDRVMTIVAAALRQPPAAREEYLRAACQGDEQLLKEVAGAIASEERTVPHPPAAPPETTRTGESSFDGGTIIGPYRLIQKIGEGGMAEVWQAEQITPVQRTVAFKLIKTGMETKAMVARFESERQAVALMEHPAIAKIFDAGSSPQGWPYFVMEYVPGVPITEYCDKFRLTNRERLELFIQVCEGVQHAHQKAIIHRDLKPSNILVTLQDGKPAPKIIDFGVAKALGSRLTGKTMFTEVGALVGTPEYMSPEQADLTEHNLDTRTDVYSLGLILYELLVGALPFDAKELRRAGYAEMLRKVREDDPPRPSTKVRTLGKDSETSARNRKTEPRILARQLDGDLDWITIKALEKDRTKRYGSPSDLAAEVGRYLRDEPILASPPSLAYRTAKFVRRHRFGASAAAVLMLLLLGFSITMTVQARRIARERDRANREAEVSKRVEQFLTGLFRLSDPIHGPGKSVTVKEILEKGAREIDTELHAQPEIQGRLLQTMGIAYNDLGMYRQAESLFERAIQARKQTLGPEHRDTLRSILWLATEYSQESRFDEAEKLLREVLKARERVVGPNDSDTCDTRNRLARVLTQEDRASEAVQLLEPALPGERLALGSEHPETLNSMMYLAMAYSGSKGRTNDAEKLFRQLLEVRRRLPSTPISTHYLASTLHFLANILSTKEHCEEAGRLYAEELEIDRTLYGMDHPNTVSTINAQGTNYLQCNRYNEAREKFNEALLISRRVFDDKFLCAPRITCAAAVMLNLASVATREGKRNLAFSTLRQAVAQGFGDPAVMASEGDLKPLHGDPRFQAILEEAGRRPQMK